MAPTRPDAAETPPIDDPLWSHAHLTLRVDLTVLGHPVVVRTNAASLATLAEATFGRFGPADPGRAALELALVAGPGTPEPVARGAPVHRQREAHFVATDGRGSLVTADLAAGTAHAFVGSHAPIEGVRAILLEATAYRFVTWHGQTALHAGAVVVDGRTLVLRGVGGAGKSTLTYAAARLGHTVLADEVVWWDAAAACLRGTPWWLRLEDDAVRLFPELAAVPPTPRAQGAPKRVAASEALGYAAVERAPAGPLVLLRAGSPRPAATQWRRLAPAEARRAFLATTIPGEHAQPAAGLDAALDALLAHGAFELTAGPPDDAVAALAAVARAAAAGAQP